MVETRCLLNYSVYIFKHEVIIHHGNHKKELVIDVVTHKRYFGRAQSKPNKVMEINSRDKSKNSLKECKETIKVKLKTRLFEA